MLSGLNGYLISLLLSSVSVEVLKTELVDLPTSTANGSPLSDTFLLSNLHTVQILRSIHRFTFTTLFVARYEVFPIEQVRGILGVLHSS